MRGTQYVRHFAQFASFLLLLGISSSLPGADMQAERLKKFNDLKFGMFIHWGPYSQASVEASWPIMTPTPGGISEADYRALGERFNPSRFDPKAWVRLAREAGQRYMVFTTKHHDGFCMFDSEYTNYKVTRSPYKKDVVAMLAEAARDEQMPLGFYYSPPDMNHPGYRDTSRLSKENWQGEPTRPEWALYLNYMDMQLRELLTRYGDVFLIWFDGQGGSINKYDGLRFPKLIHEIQPLTIVNDRAGVPGDYVTPEQWLPASIPVKGADLAHAKADPAVPLPTREQFQPWETCMTINETWAYNSNDRKFKSKTQLIRALIEAASKGGNFLLNVGPGPDGTIQPEFEERLRAIGAWLKVNGEAIYGTTFGPLQNLPFGRTTAKGSTIYLHVFDWPQGELEVSGMTAKVTAVKALADNRPLSFSERGGVLRIVAGSVARDADATVLAIETKP
jgi:alpha-L-fucosidase